MINCKIVGGKMKLDYRVSNGIKVASNESKTSE